MRAWRTAWSVPKFPACRSPLTELTWTLAHRHWLQHQPHLPLPPCEPHLPFPRRLLCNPDLSVQKMRRGNSSVLLHRNSCLSVCGLQLPFCLFFFTALSGIWGLWFDSPLTFALWFFCLVLLLFLSPHFSANGPFDWLFQKTEKCFVKSSVLGFNKNLFKTR